MFRKLIDFLTGVLVMAFLALGVFAIMYVMLFTQGCSTVAQQAPVVKEEVDPSTFTYEHQVGDDLCMEPGEDGIDYYWQCSKGHLLGR